MVIVLDLAGRGRDRSHGLGLCCGRGCGRRGHEAESFLIVVFFYQAFLTSCPCPPCPMTTQQQRELRAGGFRPKGVEGHFFLNLEVFYHDAILTPFYRLFPPLPSNAAASGALGPKDKATRRLVEDPKDQRDPKAWALVKNSRISSDLQDNIARRSVEDLKGRRDPKAC